MMARGRSRITVEGMDVLARRLGALPEAIAEGARRAVKEETKDVADDMRRGAPHDSGELEESIQEEISADGLTGTAAATARHAAFVEHGTSDTPEQPFAGPAAERSRARFAARVRREVGGELKDLIRE